MSLNPLNLEFRIARWLVEGTPSEVEVMLYPAPEVSIREVKVRLRCPGWMQSQQVSRLLQIKDEREHLVKIGVKPLKRGTWPNGELIVETISKDGSHNGIWELPSVTIFALPSQMPLQINPKAFFGIVVQGNFTISHDLVVNDYLKHHFGEAAWQCPRLKSQTSSPTRVRLATVKPQTLPSHTEQWISIPRQRFWILSTPVSQRMWQRVMGESFGSFLGRQGKGAAIAQRYAAWLHPDMPVFGITINEAEQFCERFREWCLSLQILPGEGQVRLPYEKEWRDACGLKLASDGCSWHNWQQHCYNATLPGCPRTADRPRRVTEMVRDKAVRPLRQRLYGMLGDLGELCYRAPDQPTQYRALGGTYRAEHRAICAGRSHRVIAGERLEIFGIRPICSY